MKILLALTSLLLIGCIPNRLVPHDFSIEQNNLEAYVEIDSITISLTNLEAKNDHFVFGMKIQNKSENPIFVDVDKLRKYAHHQSYREGDSNKELQEVISAMTPRQVNQFFETKHKNAQAAAAFLFLLGAAVSTYDAVKDAKDNSKSYWTEEDEKKSVTRDLVTSSALLATDILTEVAFVSGENAAVELTYLPDELFNKNVIYPNEEYYGKVLFKRIGELRRFHRIVYPIEDKNLIFDFRKATPKEKQFLHQRGY